MINDLENRYKMRARLFEILQNKNQYLFDNEMIIYIKDNGMIVLRNDGESLIETSGEVPKELHDFMQMLNNNMKKEKGYCDYCYCFNHCRWFCNKEIDENHNPIEPCYIREYEKENTNGI